MAEAIIVNKKTEVSQQGLVAITGMAAGKFA
jgi:hypothetical protein